MPHPPADLYGEEDPISAFADAQDDRDSLADNEEGEETIFVRALFDFQSSESSSLNFRVGDVIEILSQLESGWWDGVHEGQRGWLPSNYVTQLSEEEAAEELLKREGPLSDDDDWQHRTPQGGFDPSFHAGDDDDDQELGGGRRRGDSYTEPSSRRGGRDANEFWVPRVTAGGQIFYLNTQTGATSQDLPSAESQSESDDTDYAPSPSAHQETFYDSGNGPSSNSEYPHHSHSHSYQQQHRSQVHNHQRTSYDQSGLPSPSPSFSSGTGMHPSSSSTGFQPRLKLAAQLPSPWLTRMTEDGMTVYYHNPETGENRLRPPSPPPPEARGEASSFQPQRSQDRRISYQSGNRMPRSRSQSPFSSPAKLVNGHTANSEVLDDTSDLDEEISFRKRQPVGTSRSIKDRPSSGGPSPLPRGPGGAGGDRGGTDEMHRKLRELEDGISSHYEPDGIPVLALKVRNAIRRLKDAVGVRPPGEALLSPLAIEDDQQDQDLFASREERANTAMTVVIAATRRLIYASGVMDASASEALPAAAASSYFPSSSSNTLSAARPIPNVLQVSEQLKASHRRVQASLARLIVSFRLFEQDPPLSPTSSTPPPDASAVEIQVLADAEDVERTVVAFGLEAERERAFRGPSARPKRLEGWLDSVGIAHLIGGRNGFSLNVDGEKLTRPFGIDATEAHIRQLQARANQSLEALRSAASATTTANDSSTVSAAVAGDPPLHLYYELLRRINDVTQHARSFDVAAAIDLDGEDEDVSIVQRDAAYAKLVVKANELLREYEASLDSLLDASGSLVSSLGVLTEVNLRVIVTTLQASLGALTTSFLALWHVSYQQGNAVRAGTKGRIGQRRPPTTLSSSCSARGSISRMSMGSAKSRGSVSSKRSDYLRRSGKNLAQSIDQEIDDEPPDNLDEERDRFDAKHASLARGLAESSVGSLSTAGRARQSSLGGISTSSSNPSTSYDNQFRGSGSSRGVDSLRRRESDETAWSTTLISESPSRNSNKLTRMLGINPGVLPTPIPEPPWFLGADFAPEDLIMVDGERDQVKGGTLPALIVHLTSHQGGYSGHTFRETFLMTHKSFSTPSELFELLVQRFSLAPPSGLELDELDKWRAEKQLPIRLKVLNVLKIWIAENYMEDEDQTVMRKVHQFALDLPESLQGQWGKLLIRLVEGRNEGKDLNAMRKLTLTHNDFPPPSIVPPSRKTLRLQDIDPLEMARQLTLMEARVYTRIRPVECLHKAWSDLSDPRKAPNIKAVIKLSNQISRWVQVSVLADNQPKQRAAVVKHWIQIADRCLSLNNFSTVAAIVAGLGSSPIARLKRTFDLLSIKTTTAFQNVSKAVDSGKNFAAYRDQLSRVNPPSVPFLGVYLTHLTFIEDGNPNFLPGERKLINFGKRMKSADILREMQTYQRDPYNLNALMSIQLFADRSFTDAAHRTEDDLYARSKEIEPREQEPERITRMLEESGFL